MTNHLIPRRTLPALCGSAVKKTSSRRVVVVFLLMFLSLSACQQKQDPNKPHIQIQTSKGDIEIELYPQQAPQTVAAFLSYIDSGYYYNSNFYRALTMDNQPSNAPKTELIQGGIWKTNNKLAVRIPGIPHENTSQTNILHDEGVISLARAEPGTAGTEFFICLSKQPGLDLGGENVPDKQGYATFGKVIRGMGVVRKISRQNENDQYFSPPVAIYNIVRK